MQRILIDARSLADSSCGGVGIVARQWILQKTVDKNNQYVCFTSGINPSNTVKSFCDQNDFQYHHIKLPNKILTLQSLFNISLLKKITKKIGNFDSLLLPNIAYLGKINLPYQILAHDLSFLIEPKWYPLKQRIWHRLLPIPQLYKQAQSIDCVSHQTLSDLNRLLNISTEKCRIFTPQTQNHFPADPKIPDWFPKTAVRFAIIFGGSNPRKNAVTAVRAISRYNLQNPANYITPIVLGGKIKQLKNPTYVQAPNFITKDQLTWLYQNAKALLYPSWYEGFGLPLHEAHQFNLPSIASTTGALTETAPANTIFCHPAKIHEWLKALNTLDQQSPD